MTSIYKRISLAGILFATTLASGSVMACDGMGKSTHAGQIMSIDAAKHTFTIRDAQTQSPITFTANDEIMTGLQGASGSIMVNYTEEENGDLNAVGVTF